MDASKQRGHQTQLPQEGQFETKHAPRSNLGISQPAQGHHGGVEEPGVRIMAVGQVVQQLGDVKPGIKGGEVVAKCVETLQKLGLG